MSDIQWLRAAVISKPEGVDREARMIRGYVAAQLGPFKSAGRGEFDLDALKTIVKLGNSSRNGLKSRFGHPSLSDDGVGKHLGRGSNYRLSTALDARTGKEVPAVRGDLKFDPSASKSPHGDLAEYVMSLAESDSGAISSSLVLEADEVIRLDEKKRPMTDGDGNELPPLWRPTRLHASDIVDTGDAVDGLLSAKLSQSDIDQLLRFDGPARLGSWLANIITSGHTRTEAEKRLTAFVQRFLDDKFGEMEIVPTPRMDAVKDRLARMAESFQR